MMNLTNFSSVVDTYKDNFNIRKKRFFDDKKQIKDKRKKEREENIETVKAVEPLIKTRTGKKTKSNNFLDGVYKFLGFALAGLVLSNLDSIISIASDIYKKIKDLKEGIDNFVTSIRDTVDSFYSGFESFKQNLDDLLSPIINADLSGIDKFKKDFESVLGATLNVVDKSLGVKGSALTRESSELFGFESGGTAPYPNLPRSGVRQKARKNLSKKGFKFSQFKIPNISGFSVKPSPLLSSVSTPLNSSGIQPGINAPGLIEKMKNGIVNPGNLRWFTNLGGKFIIGSVLNYAAINALNKGYAFIGMDDISIIQRKVKEYMEASDDDKKEYLKRLNNGLKKQIDYQKSSAFIVEKIITMGGETNSDKMIKIFASILTTIAALSGDSVLSSDINVNDLPEALRTVYEQSSSRQPSSIATKVANDLEFQQAVKKLAKKYNVSVQDLYAVMSFETAGTFDPAQKNLRGSEATGLIQFMPETAKGLGTTTDELAKMTRTEQLKYVDKFFSNKGIEGANLDDLYMAILFPKAVGKPNDFVLFGKGATVRGYGEGSRAYKQNKLLDVNRDGSITKAEASAKVRDHYSNMQFVTPPTLTPQTKTYAILCYGTNDWSLSESQIKTNAAGMIGDLKSKGYTVVVVPPNKDLFVKGVGKKPAPYRGVHSAAKEAGVTIELGKYSTTDTLHLEPIDAERIRNKYKPAIYVGDSNAVGIAGKLKQAKAKIKGKTTTTAVTGYGGNKIQELIDNISTSPSKSPTISATGLTATLENMISQNSHNSNGKVTTLLDAEKLVANNKDSSDGLNKPTRYNNGAYQTKEIVNNIIIPITA